METPLLTLNYVNMVNRHFDLCYVRKLGSILCICQIAKDYQMLNLNIAESKFACQAVVDTKTF